MEPSKTLRRIIFAGTPEFAAPCLTKLVNAGYNIVAVYTQPDRPAGRGQKIRSSAVKKLARKYSLPVLQPDNLRASEEISAIRQLQPDAIIVVAYGLMIPAQILEIPRFGCINVHASLLPRWRGAAPIQRSILAGDTEAGITIMQMNFGLDTGPILSQVASPILATDTAGRLHDRLADLGSTLLLVTLPRLARELILPQPQGPGATYAGKINKQEAEINWHSNSVQISRQIRAFNPWPIAYSTLCDINIRIFRADILNETPIEPPGTILYTCKEGIDVAALDGVLRLTEIQLPGGNVLKVSEILKSKADLFKPGRSFQIKAD